MNPAFQPSLFRSFFLGGFECSTLRRADGRRLDLIAGTRHDLSAEEDYRQLTEHGIHAARDGVRCGDVPFDVEEEEAALPALSR